MNGHYSNLTHEAKEQLSKCVEELSGYLQPTKLAVLDGGFWRPADNCEKQYVSAIIDNYAVWTRSRQLRQLSKLGKLACFIGYIVNC